MKPIKNITKIEFDEWDGQGTLNGTIEDDYISSGETEGYFKPKTGRFIAQAVNSHNDLLKACKEVIKYFKDDSRSFELEDIVLNYLVPATKKAEGKS